MGTTSAYRKYLNSNQLIRMREIFAPFFRVLEDRCISYSIYNCKIEGKTVGNESRIVFDFLVSDEKGVEKRDVIIYVLEEDDFYVRDTFKFEKGSEKKVREAIKKVIYDLNSVDILFNKIHVEFGSRWIMGGIFEDIDPKTGVKYDGYILFLKSELAFGDHSVQMEDKSFLLN